MLTLQNLSIGYQKPLLQHVNASVNQGDICVLLGRNGSGKSTLIKSILKNISLLNGNILIDDQSISDYSFETLSHKIAVVYSQNMVETQVNVYDLIALGRYPFKKWYEKLNSVDNQLIEKAIVYCGIETILDKNANELSDGNLQKVFIARAIAQNTPILLLDEPLSHLDIENQFMIMKIFENLANNEQKTILFTSHEWDLSLTIANKLWYIKNDTLTSGLVEDVAIQENLISAFSNSGFEFNFNLNKFVQKIDNQVIKSVNVVCNAGKDETIYWLTRALRKNNILLDEKAKISIIPTKNGYLRKQNNKEVEFKSIEELIINLKM